MTSHYPNPGRREFLKQGSLAAAVLTAATAVAQDEKPEVTHHQHGQHNAGQAPPVTPPTVEHRHDHVEAVYDGFSRYVPSRGNDPDSDYYIGKLVPGFRKAEEGPAPFEAPDLDKLPFTLKDGVKEFHLVPQSVQQEFLPGQMMNVWGFNGSMPGPTIEINQGDRVRIVVTNELPEDTTVHWHGVFLPSGMDGVGGLSQPVIPPGETFLYEFPLRQNGTFMYHAHHDEMTQIALGLTGLFIIHPRQDRQPVDRDVALMLHEWYVEPGTSRPDPNKMSDFNLLTLNGKAFPGTDPIVVGHNDRVRIRFGNLSPMDHHPIHIHGHAWKTVATDGGRIPASGQWPETTVLVPTGATRTVEFVADGLGDWALHCHMTHHVMNQMGHELPNLIGVKPGELDKRAGHIAPGYMTMGQEGMGDMERLYMML